MLASNKLTLCFFWMIVSSIGISWQRVVLLCFPLHLWDGNFVYARASFDLVVGCKCFLDFFTFLKWWLFISFTKCPTDPFSGKKTNCSRLSLKSLSTAQIMLPRQSVINTGLCGNKVTSTEYLFHLKLDWTRCLKIQGQEYLWYFAVFSSKVVLLCVFPSSRNNPEWECSLQIPMM